MELRCLGLGIRRDKRIRKMMRNVKVTNKVKINVLEVGRDGFRGPTRECFNFPMIVFKDR